jgi:hypothetical protein
MFCNSSSCDSEADEDHFDVKQCCEIKDTCGEMQCPETTVPKKNAADAHCFTTECDNTNSYDLNTCCVDRAMCTTLECGTGWKNKAVGMCAGDECQLETDQDTCCDQLDKCSDMECNADIHHVKRASAPEYCASTQCEVDECCVEKQRCDLSLLECGDGRDLKMDASDIHCATEECSAADLNTCCEDKANCSTMVSGDGMLYCSSLTSCADGLIGSAATTMCANTGCTSDLCCLQAFGPPLPETLPDPVPQDTFKAGFKLEASFEALSAPGNEEVLEALEDSICEKFAESTGTNRDWCTAEFSAGSVNVAVTITAPAEESLPTHMPAPTPADVVEAVVAIPDVESIQKGDTPISASEVKAVVFKKGTTAAVAATTSTTTKATTTVEDATTEEPVDSAIIVSAATPFLLAIAPWMF